jgi:hypothetical protein
MSYDPRPHYRLFQHNAALVARLEAALPQDRNWGCVIRFYAALHLVDAYLTTKFFKRTVFSHVDRQRAVQRYPECRRFETAYRHLQGLSELVRYDPLFVYNDSHHAEANRYYAKVVAVVEPWVKSLLGPGDPPKEQP